MSELIGYLSEVEHLDGMLSGQNQLEGELSLPEVVNVGLSEEVKQALLDLFQHLAYTDADGQDYYDALYNAFYPPAELISISAVYTQSGSVFPDTPLDDLKDDLVVTAHYSDSTTEVVPSADYTLSGTLTAGTSVITVTYEDKTTTFNVTVSEPAVLSSITAVYTQSGTVYPTDSLDSLKPDLVVTAHYSDSSTATVTTYTLSGSLTVGTSTITVTYSDKTTTFNVTVTAVPVLDSITAVYTQSGTVYDTDSLDSLKDDLVVTATYSDSSTATVPSADYTLSGTLTVGTSTITVSYSGQDTTFNVTVTQYWTYQWDYTMGKLEEQTGWKKDVSGSASTSLVSDGEKFETGNGAYYQAFVDSAGSLANIRTMSDGYGTIEMVCYGVYGTSSNGNNMRLTIAKDASTRLTLNSFDHKWRLTRNATPSSAENTPLADCPDNTTQTIKVVLKDTKADVYVDGIKVGDNVDAIANAGSSNCIMHQSGGTGHYTVVKSLKIRVGAD